MRNPRRTIVKLLTRLFDKSLPEPAQRDLDLVQELRNNILNLLSFEALSSSHSGEAWQNNVKRLMANILNDDPREFLRWDVISKTMSVGLADYVFRELKFLKSQDDWRSRWRKAIVESKAGHPVPYWRYPKSSSNLVHHAYHVSKFEEVTGQSVHEMDFVFEFGGGYGSSCRLFHNLGFKGRYVIYDLPGFSALQQYYLKSSGLRVRPMDKFHEVSEGVFCISSFDRLQDIFSYQQNNSCKSLCVATWSLSETPLSLRTKIQPLLSRVNCFLVAYQEQFGEVNNSDYFRDLLSNRQDVRWKNWEIEHLPGNNYLMGAGKSKVC